ncbi:HAMP domain-containing sensor histidine kinase [Paraglaciecola sp. Hal342]
MELIRNLQTDPASMQTALTTMERQVTQMVRLIDDLLDISRISKDKLSLKRQHVVLKDIVEHAVEVVTPYANRLKHTVQINLPEQPIHLFADPARLAQVLGNLLNNACKYTPKSGFISLTVTQSDEQVHISVKDNGLGIEQEMLNQVFDLFTQVDQHLEQSGRWARDRVVFGATLSRNARRTRRLYKRWFRPRFRIYRFFAVQGRQA